MTDPRTTPLSDTLDVRCSRCGSTMRFGTLGIYECTGCAQKFAVASVSTEHAPITEPDAQQPHFTLGLTDRWYELDMYASLSVSWWPMAFMARCLCGWSFAWGAYGLVVAICAWFGMPSEATRFAMVFALWFTCATGFTWLFLARHIRPLPES